MAALAASCQPLVSAGELLQSMGTNSTPAASSPEGLLAQLYAHVILQSAQDGNRFGDQQK